MCCALGFVLWSFVGMLGPVDQQSRNSASPLIAKVQRLSSRDLALENDYLLQENKILRRKLGSRVPLTEADRRVLVKYGLRIRDRTRGGHFHRQARNAPGLASSAEATEMDFRQPGQSPGTSSQIPGHRSADCTPGRGEW